MLGDNFTKGQLDATVEAARALRVEVVTESFGAPPYDLDAAFARGRAAQANALIVLTSPAFSNQSAKIFELAMKQRLPVSRGSRRYGDQGILFCFSQDLARHWARAGDIAASILGGKTPGDIPLEQPSHFELAINLRTARALGITVPQSMPQRADRVIE